MGQLLDKLDRASRGAVQPLGFGAAKRERIAPMLLLGMVQAGDAAQAKLVAEAGLDGAIVLGRAPAKQVDVDRTAKALDGVTFGVWQDQAQAADRAGADFQVFSSEDTPIGVFGDEEQTTVMQVVPELDDSLLRTIDHLPVDAFLVSLVDAESLTIRELMRLARVRGMTSRWLLAHLRALPDKVELEQLRDAGVGAIVVDMADHTAEALKTCQEMLLGLPHEVPERHKARTVATLPFLGAPSAGRGPEPEPDDDDWDDE